ncbi:hypothetical protein QX233_20740 [Chryseobacterium gambrini]|uniref:Uncharacterized protein n=1 Tax=Chryseobacterium gambrini TaxID=373672 RepID=A0AAJ1VMI7_9FLAO|nr:MULTISPECIES: hypothetical protein [Chryseobacterium]MCQ4139417.1 hypothetical protein [Chryseobacterium sp. EO14]MDN4014901.1 hypothetical protein [Chryseobacterium gambrini]QWA39564.1 hypothetical protein KKI44_04980 [Chryseobacterium sp. ZHDP1]
MVITTAIVTSLLLNLTQKGLEKAFETGGEKISEGAMSWVKGLFYKNGEPKKALKELQDDPTNANKQEVAKGIIENSIEDDENNLKYFEELIKNLPKSENTISNSKNVVTGNISVGGNSIVGDGNTIN